MEKSPHVMIAGTGAEEFALQQGFTLVPNSYFRTEARMRQLEKAQQEEKAADKASGKQSEKAEKALRKRTSLANPSSPHEGDAHSVASLLPQSPVCSRWPRYRGRRLRSTVTETSPPPRPREA